MFVEQTRVNRPITSGFGYSYPDYVYFREHARAFTELAAHNSTMPPMIVATPGGPVGVSGAVVTANYFTLLRLTPRAGRFFSVDEDRMPGRDAVAILSYDGVLVRPVRGIRMLEQRRMFPLLRCLPGRLDWSCWSLRQTSLGSCWRADCDVGKRLRFVSRSAPSRGRLIRLLLVESVMRAAAGGVAGLQIAVWATEVLRAYFANLDLSLDLRIALIGFGVALFTGVATGNAPALQSTRPDMALAMKEGSAGASRPRSIAREGLIVVQVALSVLLLGAGGLIVHSFFMLHRGPGFDPDRVAIVRLRPSLAGFTTERAWAYQREVIERLEALPGVLAASPASAPPSWRAQPVTPARLPGDSSDPAHAYQVGTALVGPRYFKTLGVDVVEGREFDDRDTMDGPRAAIVNETLARHFWPNGGELAG